MVNVKNYIYNTVKSLHKISLGISEFEHLIGKSHKWRALDIWDHWHWLLIKRTIKLWKINWDSTVNQLHLLLPLGQWFVIVAFIIVILWNFWWLHSILYLGLYPHDMSSVMYIYILMTHLLMYIIMYKDVSKSSRTVIVKRSLLTLDVKFLHHLHSTPLLHEYSGPSFSAMLGSIPGSPFLELCQVPAAIPLESIKWCRIFDPSSKALAWGRGKSHRGPDWVSMGDHYHVVLGQKLRNFKGPVSRVFVVVDNEVLVLPFLWPLAPHIFT